jgi:hypothetical protein
MRDGCRAEFSHHNATRPVGQSNGRFDCQTSGQRRGQGGNDGVSCATHIKDLPSLCRDMQAGPASGKEGHAVFAARDQQVFQAQLCSQRLGPGGEIRLIDWPTHHLKNSLRLGVSMVAPA